MTFLPISDAEIERLSFDYAVSISTSMGLLTIETPFSVTDQIGRRFEVDPASLVADAGVLFWILRRTIEVASYDADSGSLRLVIEGGAVIVVPPDEKYEAWSLSVKNGPLFVCMPGGGVGDWSSID